MDNIAFIKKVENMISPQDIATLQMMAPLSTYIPSQFQNAVMERSAEDNPYMGFVVEPYSLFVCYEILDLEWAERLIPDGFELIKTRIFEDGEPKYYMIFGSFNVHTSAFWGTRLEVNVIARNKETGLLSWIIVDYDTNTLSHDRLHGVVGSTTDQALLTTDYEGTIIVEIENQKRQRAFTVHVRTHESQEKKLDTRLWLEGNLSVGYGREISQNSSDAFLLLFNQKEVEKAQRVPLEHVTVTENTWFKGLFKNEPDEVVYFPYAQHYLSDSPGHYSEINSTDEMITQYKQLNLDAIPDYSAASHRKMIKRGLIMNTFLIGGLMWALFKKKKN